MAAVEPRYDQRNWMVAGAALLMVASGIVHFIIIPHHLDHAPAHGVAMGVIGGLEGIWAILFWLKPSRRLAQAGIILAISMIALWTITRVAPAPFTNAPEEVDLAGVVSKALEAIAAVVLLLLVLRSAPAGAVRWAPWHTVITVILISVLLAVGTYEVARAAQPFFPQLNAPAGEHGHEEGEDYGHEDGEEH